MPRGLAGRDLLFVLGLTPLLFAPGTLSRNCLSSGTGPPNNFSSWTAASSFSRDVGFETPRRSTNKSEDSVDYGLKFGLSTSHIFLDLHAFNCGTEIKRASFWGVKTFSRHFSFLIS